MSILDANSAFSKATFKKYFFGLSCVVFGEAEYF